MRIAQVTLRLCTATVLCAVAYATVHEARAQELNCIVRVDYSKLPGADYDHLDEFQRRIDEYINDRRWTDDQFQEFERIDCQFQINFEEALSLTSFRAGLVVAARRPIYGTLQTTTVVQFNDTDWQFTYAQGQPLNSDQERYDPITSVLNYYAFLILGYDYDTFDELGGTQYFDEARRIAEKARSQNAPGWSEVGSDRGRIDLVTQLLNPTFRPLRQAYFTYHFGALDRFARDPEVARQTVYEQLEALNELYEQQGRTYAVDLFFNAKYSELTALFLQSRISNQVLSLLSMLDSAHLTEYNKLSGQ